MCRSIKTLRAIEPAATDDGARAAALQYVRKISGYGKPSVANAHAFEHAVADVAEASRRLLDALVVRPAAA
ncbi:MAG: DUF2277 domain-containing protein [Chloroflexi bacterium]|nr:DUF2277 domain-containing protein [Chloroflexota bacterium]